MLVKCHDMVKNEADLKADVFARYTGDFFDVAKNFPVEALDIRQRVCFNKSSLLVLG